MATLAASPPECTPECTPATEARKLAVLPLVTAAFADVAANWRVVLRLVTTWGILSVACLTLATLIFGQVESDTPFSTWQVVVLLALMAPSFVAMCSVAVGWHRFILLGEMPGKVYLAAGADVWRYLISLVLIALLTGLLIAIVSIPMTALAFASPRALVFVSLVCNVLAMLLMSRLGLSLPHIALGNHRNLGSAFDNSAGNTWRLAAAGMLSWLPLIAASKGTELLPSVAFEFGAWLPLFAVFTLMWLFAGIASVGVMSHAYRSLWRNPK